MFISNEINYFYTDAEYVLRKQGYCVKRVTKLEKVSEKVYRAWYELKPASDGHIYKGSVLVSVKNLQSAKVAQRIDRSKAVEFDYVNAVPGEDAVVATTTKGHSVTLDYSAHTLECDCQDYGTVEVSGYNVCKHSLAFAKSTIEPVSINDLIQWLSIGKTARDLLQSSRIAA